jgi:hypothetical protein
MTTPIEQSIRKAENEVAHLSRELDITNADHIALWFDAHGYEIDGHLAVQIAEAYEHALARRIEAEVVPVAWRYTRDDRHKVFPFRDHWRVEAGWTETPLYARQPKEPTT